MYYDLNDIEAESQRVPANFEITIAGLGRQSDEQNIEQGAKLALPMWLAIPLATAGTRHDGSAGFVDLEEPSAFSEDVLNALRSDAVVVDLYEECPVFTPLALSWTAIFDNPQLAEVLYDTTQQRLTRIYDNAVALKGPWEGFDEYERRVYKSAHNVRKDMAHWQSL